MDKSDELEFKKAENSLQKNKERVDKLKSKILIVMLSIDQNESLATRFNIGMMYLMMDEISRLWGGMLGTLNGIFEICNNLDDHELRLAKMEKTRQIVKKPDIKKKLEPMMRKIEKTTELDKNTIHIIEVYMDKISGINGDLILGDVFKNIQNATIINKSIVKDSFNKVKGEYDEDVAKALLQIGEFIENSGDLSAGILYNKFNEELNKPQVEKSTLTKIWDGIEKTLPSIATISEVIAKLAPLF